MPPYSSSPRHCHFLFSYLIQWFQVQGFLSGGQKQGIFIKARKCNHTLNIYATILKGLMGWTVPSPHVSRSGLTAEPCCLVARTASWICTWLTLPSVSVSGLRGGTCETGIVPAIWTSTVAMLMSPSQVEKSG